MVSALALGIVLAFLVAFNLPNISDRFDGAGQEVLFVAVLLLLSLMIQWINVIVILPGHLNAGQSLLKRLFSGVIIFAISLEGAEIIIFFQSGMANENSFYPNLLGSILGVGIGISAGAVSYYLLDQLSKGGIIIALFLLVMVSAGMASQSVSYLMQADLIDSGYPIWDTSSLIDERSVMGQLLYALMGYEATPSLVQAIAYFSYIGIPLTIYIYSRYTLDRGR